MTPSEENPILTLSTCPCGVFHMLHMTYQERNKQHFRCETAVYQGQSQKHGFSQAEFPMSQI